MQKRTYSKITISRVNVTPDSPVLAGSIINNVTVSATEQTVGKVYDFSEKPVGDDAGKYFNHEWE